LGVPARTYTCIVEIPSIDHRPSQHLRSSGARAVIFDGDDTLWETEPLYDRARSEAAQVVAGAGFDPDEFESVQRSIDARNVETMGLSMGRFPTSSVQAFEEIARRAGKVPPDGALERVYAVSAEVFNARAPLLPSAEEVLSSLRGTYQLGLLTKGAEQVQKRRVDGSGLRKYFDRVNIVQEKNTEIFLRLLRELGAEPSVSWSVGNSLPSDVAPAIQAGMQAIWIDAHVWVHERRDSHANLANPGLFVATELRDIPSILAAATPEPAASATSLLQ
jgi:putative hydrolase of the HAD superfamily